MKVFALVATIPTRKRSCERLLAELQRQTRPPDAVILVLDGYAAAEVAPACPLPVAATYRSLIPKGAGARWLSALDLLHVDTTPAVAQISYGGTPPVEVDVAAGVRMEIAADKVEIVEVEQLAVERVLQPDDVVVCLDDDVITLEAPRLFAGLVEALERGGGAAAAMGRAADGKQAPPGAHSRGELVYAAGCGLALRARHLEGLDVFAAEVLAGGGPDALGLLGDDDALVSAHLWKTRTPVLHAMTGNIYAAPNTRATSQTIALSKKRGYQPDAQKMAISKATGWPWRASAR